MALINALAGYGGQAEQIPDPATAAPQQSHGFMNALGRIGDVLAIVGDRAPVYSTLQAQDLARQRQTDTRNALARFAQNPEDQGAFRQFLALDPKQAIDIRNGLQGDPYTLSPGQARYQGGKEIAQGPAAPPASTPGKQAMDAGFVPGTPEFAAAVRKIAEAEAAQPYTGSQGETRLYRPDLFGGQQPQRQAPQQPHGQTVTPQEFGNAMGGLPAETAAGLAQQLGMAVQVTTPDEVAALPSGVTFIAPDGIPRVKH